MWHVSPSCWNQMLPISSSSIFCEQKFVQHGPITINIDCNDLYLLIFEEKMAQVWFGTKNRTKQWFVLGASVFQCVCVRVVFAPNATTLLVYMPTKAQTQLRFIWKYDCFAKIGIFCKSIAGPLSEAKTHRMVNWIQLPNQLNFVCHYTKVFMQNSSQWCLRNVQLLRMTVNWCWWRFTHTFCSSSNILGCMHSFRLFKLWFIDEDASFFHFFHKIMNMRIWRTQFSHTFGNITMIFKVMPQYFLALFKRIHNHIRAAEG